MHEKGVRLLQKGEASPSQGSKKVSGFDMLYMLFITHYAFSKYNPHAYISHGSNKPYL